MGTKSRIRKAHPSAVIGGCTIEIRDGQIVVADGEGMGMILTPSRGPAGLSLTINKIPASPALSLSGNEAESMEVFSGPDMSEVAVTQYCADADSQAFKLWYQKDGGR